MKILITGASGFIGRNLKEYLESRGGYKVYAPTSRELDCLDEIQVKNKIVPAMGFASEEELLYHQTFFCEGLSAVIRRWVRGGCKESPEEMERIIEAEYHPNRDLLFPQGN